MKTKKQTNAVDWTTDSKSILLDLKVMMKDYYVATVAEENDYLTLKFINGQKFKISIDEIE